ncbi:hydroxyacylglutathione hydrolase [Thiohalocapsa marina]|uniref:Hydroxyacylglutathione hydrolase n=1 Tax=Thiohalocapsa marina TaxID=424902 RepID=A0A5M8FQT6_9GAMM|nr:hydroxyacylglutathione hydrolase [Thiohalocapsa marina]KAA6183402.1 hydroxyacylglutathione hydrolase [Thiohalocapsa marina]
MDSLRVAPIPAFDDNYIWLLREGDAPTVAVVDPGDAEPVIARLRADGLTLTAVLVTHHHGDHTGGIDELLAEWPDAEVIAPADRRIPSVTQTVADADRVVPAGLRTEFQVLAVPGHTSTHVAYLGAGALFCGDTLFAGGCGRVFDGTFEQLAVSLRRIAALPAETLCYCAHEYTLANLGFAAWVEPDSAALAERTRAAQALRAAGRPTVPSELGLERATNPFLRTAEPAVIAAAEGFAGARLADATEVFTALRRWKDTRYD